MNEPSAAFQIETERLLLVPCESKHLEALMRDKKELEPILDIKVPDSWPVFPQSVPQLYELSKSLSASADASALQWGFYLFIHAKDRALVGEGGFKGTPDKEGMVEIGYAIIPECRGYGLATEAAHAMTRHAFACPQVKTVQAHTLQDGTESIRVLEKLGMKLVGTFNDPEDGDVLRWEVERGDTLS